MKVRYNSLGTKNRDQREHISCYNLYVFNIKQGGNQSCYNL